MIGQVVGNYKITEKLGEGGMGAVFKGLDLMINRDVAIKILRPELARQQAIVERFRSEAITLGKLSHAHIATLYSFIRQGDDLFMVMEYVEGHTLEKIIKTNGALPVERAVQLFCQALDGIAHAHRHGVIHRDIKPANLMLTHTGIMKVMDFGIARAMNSARLTRTGNLVGTMEYMSPEQIRGEATDARSDIYSLGILLYEMLTGRVPFESSSDYELMRRQVEEAPIPPRTFSSQIPLPIERIIMRALAKKKEARFQTADEFRLTLLQSISQMAEPPKPSSVKPYRVTTLIDGSKSSGTEVPAAGAAQLKETRLGEGAEQKVMPSIRQVNELPTAHGQVMTQQPDQVSPAFFRHGNRKAVVGLVLLSVCLIPITWFFAGTNNSPSATNKNVTQRKMAGFNPLPSAPVDAQDQPPVVTPEKGATQPEDEATRTDRPSSTRGVTDKVTGRRATAKARKQRKESNVGGQPQPASASTQPDKAMKPDDNTTPSNKDKEKAKEKDKDKEKKGGVFGIFKKLNPFKKSKD